MKNSGLLGRIKWKNLILTLLGAISILFLLYKGIDKLWISESEKYELMPNNAPLYITSSNKSILSQSKDISELSEQFLSASFLSTYQTQCNSIREQLLDTSNTEILSGIYEVNQHEYNYLHIVYVGFHWNDEPSKFFNASFLATKNLEKRVFKSNTIYQNGGENPDFSYTYKNGFLMISASADLIDNFIRKYDDGEVLSKDNLFTRANNSFQKIEKTNSAAIKIILNYAQSASISELISQIRGENLLKEVSNINGFSILALDIQKSNFSLKGVSAFDNELLLKSNLDNTNAKANVLAYLPENIAILSAFNVGKVNIKNNKLSPIFSAGDIDKMAFFEIENRDLNDEKYAGCVIHSKNIKASLTQLKAINASEQSSIVYGSSKIPLQSTKIKNEIHELFGHSFFHISSPYYFYINDCIIFVNKAETAQFIADHYQNKNTLKDSPQHALQFMFRADLIPQLTEQLFRINDSSIELSCIQKINMLTVHFDAEQSVIKTEINFSVDKNSKTEATNIVWQSELQNKWQRAPEIVEIAGEEHFYVVVQDEKKQVYFYNDAGELQWKKELDSKLISNFYPIDYYNNATIQFAFHSENYLYIVDKYGNNIEDFPIRLGASTNLSMTVFHENNSLHQSSYFIPCSNGNIYGYDVKGSPLVGWNPKNAGVLSESLQQIKQNKKNLLLGTSIDGSIRIWDISGAEKLNLSAQNFLVPHFSNILVDTSTYLFNAAHAHILKYSIDGKIEEKPFGPASDTFDYCAFLPSGTKVPNHAILERNVFKILDHTGKKIMSYAFEEKMNLNFKHVSIRNEDLFVCTNVEKNKTYVLNAKGELFDGFPASLQSSLSIISIGDNAYAVAMSSDSKLLCYRL